MIRRHRATHSSLFLLELILAILFFSIASAVCIQLFVKSHLLNLQAQNLNYAVHICSNVSEIISASSDLDTLLEDLKVYYADATLTNNKDSITVVIYYDEDFTACDSTKAFYQLFVNLNTHAQQLNADLLILPLEGYTAMEPVYELHITHHFPRKA